MTRCTMLCIVVTLLRLELGGLWYHLLDTLLHYYMLSGITCTVTRFHTLRCFIDIGALCGTFGYIVANCMW